MAKSKSTKDRSSALKYAGQCAAAHSRACCWGALINSPSWMTGKADGAQEARHIEMISELLSTTQRSQSLAQSINPRFPNYSFRFKSPRDNL